MGFCTKCGSQLGENSKFCIQCGASIGEAANLTVTESANTATTPSQPTSNSQPQHTQQSASYNSYQTPSYNSYPTPQDTYERPVTIGAWIGYMLLSVLGIIGQIIILFTTQSKTVKNWIFAAWIYSAILVTLILIFVFCMSSSIFADIALLYF